MAQLVSDTSGREHEKEATAVHAPNCMFSLCRQRVVCHPHCSRGASVATAAVSSAVCFPALLLWQCFLPACRAAPPVRGGWCHSGGRGASRQQHQTWPRTLQSRWCCLSRSSKSWKGCCPAHCAGSCTTQEGVHSTCTAAVCCCFADVKQLNSFTPATCKLLKHHAAFGAEGVLHASRLTLRGISIVLFNLRRSAGNSSNSIRVC